METSECILREKKTENVLNEKLMVVSVTVLVAMPCAPSQIARKAQNIFNFFSFFIIFSLHFAISIMQNSFLFLSIWSHIYISLQSQHAFGLL